MKIIFPVVLAAVVLCSPPSFAAHAAEGKPGAAKAAPPIPILSRKEWNAKPPVLPMKKHRPNLITIHHTGVKQKPGQPLAEKIRGLQNYSQKEAVMGNGRKKAVWADVPYHYYVAADGRTAEGREVEYVGDTNTEYDPTGHLLVVLEGNFEEEQPSEAQMKAACKLVAWLAQTWGVPPKQIAGHKDYAPGTACPGKNLIPRLSEFREEASLKTAAPKTDGKKP